MSGNDVKIVRLMTGEELIGTFHTVDEEGYFRLKDVAILIPTRENSIGLMQFMPYTKVDQSGLVMREDHVLFFLAPTDDLLTTYQNMFSKIMTPPKGIIAT